MYSSSGHKHSYGDDIIVPHWLRRSSELRTVELVRT